MKIAIASGKGGTGKTTLSTNFSHFLAQRHRVVLVDLDVEEPNSKLFIDATVYHQHHMYKKIPQWHVDACHQCGACVSHCNYNALLHIANEILVFPNLCHSCFACAELCPASALEMVNVPMGELYHYSAQQMDLIEGRLNVGEEQAVALIGQTKGYVEHYFGEDTIKIYDAPPGTSCPMVAAVKDADVVLLVTEPTPFGIHDLHLAVETLRVLQKPFMVVINKDGIGDGSLEAYLASENIVVAARIAHERGIAEAYAKGSLMYRDVASFEEALRDLESHLHVKEAL